MIISHLILLRLRNFSDKIVEGIKMLFNTPITFFPKILLFIR